MNSKISLLPISVEVHPEITLSFNIPKKTTVKKLISVIKSYHLNNSKHKTDQVEIVGLATKVGDPQADLWLSNVNNTLETFRKNTLLQIVYKNKHPKIYKTQIRNYTKLGRSQTNVRALVVRNNLSCQIFTLYQFPKDQIAKYEQLQRILQLHSFLTKVSQVKCLPKVYKAFESKKNFNIVLEFVPLQINAKMTMDRIKQIIKKVILVIEELYRMGFGFVQWKINDFQLTFASQIKMVNIEMLTYAPYSMEQINFGQNCFEVISQLLIKMENQLEETNTSISHIRKSFHGCELSNDSTVRMFLGFDFNDFMVEISSGKYTHASDIIHSSNWLTQKNKKFSLKYQLRFPSHSFHYGETVRNEFQDDQRYSFQPINNFFAWQFNHEKDYFQDIEIKTIVKKKKRAKIQQSLIKKPSLTKVFNKILKKKLK